MKVNGLDIERLRREGTPRRQALEALTIFVRQHTEPGTHAVFVGHNAPFDWSFVSWACCILCSTSASDSFAWAFFSSMAESSSASLRS